ncbi:hypothetical protein CYMTET_20204 [Cymbomonas tetramitiformis]|uniref:Uncharacterized protein n=1 Tax=Cymbomonas tetramitiformis TaxID=36881 RepID=A0AAE0G5V4_9CHLO|nr:hypothetical protein CYMTET_20204 [Cymbomonas tetramitiformis]
MQTKSMNPITVLTKQPASAVRSSALRASKNTKPRPGSSSRLALGRRYQQVTKAVADGSDDTASKAIAAAVPVIGLAGSAALINAHVIDEPVLSYLNTVGVPVINALNPPEFVIHWFHALNMGVVLFAMGGYGTYLGWRIRAGYGDEDTFGTPDSAAELHWKLMAGMGFFFLLGGQGGLIFTLLEDRTLFASPHAITATAGLGVLAAQGVLGATMKDSETLRTTHAYLGSTLMALFVAHAALGLKLGLSF